MKRKGIRKSTALPILLLFFGGLIYVYDGMRFNSWRENLPNMLIMLALVVILFFVLRKKEKYQDEREK